MNLQKAIELLNSDINDPGSIDIIPLEAAEQLGIEALSALSYMRNQEHPIPPELLPSETKD